VDKEEVKEEYQAGVKWNLIVRKYYDIRKSHEFRCFVYKGQVIGKNLHKKF
jgi:hypothetical protein